jgi:thymidine phosphorylase
LPRAAATLEVGSPAAGRVESVDAEALGLAAMALGAGRSRIEDRVDPGAGLEVWKKVGDPVDVGESLVRLHVGSAPLEPQETVAVRVRGAYRIGAGPATAGPLVLERIEEGA